MMLHIFYSFVDGRAGGLSFWLHISGPSQSFGGIIEMSTWVVQEAVYGQPQL